jgi:hypothetical protein
VAEWLGTGLQNQLQRFESARNLRIRKAPARDASWGFLVAATWKLASMVGDAKKDQGLCAAKDRGVLTDLRRDRGPPSEAKAIR